MPTYQYSCTECGHFLEVVQSFSDDSLTVCPVCEGRLRKVFGAVGVVFKGSGFYRNDSRGKDTSESGGSSAAKDASTSTPAKDAGSSSTKAAPTSTPATKDSGSTSSDPGAKSA